MAHTDGPWYVGKHGDNDSDVCAEGGPLICSLRGGSADACDTTADDDARLIAAAPEMLAAIRQAMPLVDAYRRSSGGDGDVTALLMRSVIAKAEGRE